MVLAGVLIAALGLLIPVWLSATGELSRVRTAVRAAEPKIDCTIGTYSGAGSGLHAAIHNSGEVRAYDLSLSFPTMDGVWHEAFLERGDWARPQIPIPDDAPLRTTKMVDPTAKLTYTDRFGLAYTLRITLTQTGRDDRGFNLGSLPGGTVERPALTVHKVWRLRKEV